MRILFFVLSCIFPAFILAGCVDYDNNRYPYNHKNPSYQHVRPNYNHQKPSRPDYNRPNYKPSRPNHNRPNVNYPKPNRPWNNGNHTRPGIAACTSDYRPVCAIRGNARQTFANACAAKAAGYRVAGQGNCR